MVKCTKGQVRRLKTALRWKLPAEQRQRIQMVLLRKMSLSTVNWRPDRFLAEYALVRTLSDEPPVRALALENWSYFAATYPMGLLPTVGAELEIFSGTAPDSLRAHGIAATAIPSTRDAFYDAMANGNFDVLHISCHAQSSHQSIEQASLIIGDETTPGKPRLIEVDPLRVEKGSLRLHVRPSPRFSPLLLQRPAESKLYAIGMTPESAVRRRLSKR